MIKLLILSGFIGIVCVKIHGMSFMKKLAVKIVMVWVPPCSAVHGSLHYKPGPQVGKDSASCLLHCV